MRKQKLKVIIHRNTIEMEKKRVDTDLKGGGVVKKQISIDLPRRPQGVFSWKEDPYFRTLFLRKTKLDAKTGGELSTSAAGLLELGVVVHLSHVGEPDAAAVLAEEATLELAEVSVT